MNEQINLPVRKLSRDVIKVWLISESIENGIGFIMLGILLYLDYLFSWKEWIGWILLGITVLGVGGSLWSFIRPFILYKNWRYDVDEEFLQFKSGVVKQVYQLVPMTKIQSVAMEQGPILRKYGLYSVSVETMGSSHAIPGLPEEVAIELRNQIAHYARLKEVEE